jgi:hypothetical protein
MSDKTILWLKEYAKDIVEVRCLSERDAHGVTYSVAVVIYDDVTRLNTRSRVWERRVSRCASSSWGRGVHRGSNRSGRVHRSDVATEKVE